MSPKKKSNFEEIYGLHAACAAWLNPKRICETLFLSDKSLNSFEGTLKQAKSQGISRPAPQIKPKEFFTKRLGEDAVHQQILIGAKPLNQPSLHDLTKTTDKHFLVMLDQVTDPQNIGAIMRSACAYGAKALIVQDKNAPELTPIIYKNACGAVEHLPYMRETNLTKSIQLLKDQGYWIYGLSEKGKASFDQINFPEKTLIILGAEGKGMRRLIEENCDELCNLPTGDPLPTLNVANAAACAFYGWKINHK